MARVSDAPTSSDPLLEPAAGSRTDAHRDGLQVDRGAVEALVEAAAAFLVAEETLDALEG